MAQVGINKIRKHSRPCSADIFVRFPSKHAALNHHEERERRSPRRARSLAVSTISGWEPGQATLPTPTRRDASSSAFLPASCCALSFLPPPSDGDATSDPHRSAGPSFWGQSRGLCPFLKQRRNQQSSTFAIGHPETKGWNSWLNQPTTVGLQLCKFFSASIQPKRKGEEKENRIASRRISPSHEDATSDSPRLRVTARHGSNPRSHLFLKYNQIQFPFFE